jgi:pimeloyl-ACP methyl ester carboxylesterase
MRAIILVASFIVVASITGVAAQGSGEKPQSHKIFVNGLWLAYKDVGKGPPIVLVPGSLSDYRIWFNQIEPFSQHNRVIAYSRRYNWPNSAPGQGADGSMMRQVDDLSALIKGLGIAPVHIVGHSYGGTIALFLATSHPEVVRTLVLVEPNAPPWLENMPGAEADLKAIQNFNAAFQQALASGDAERAVKTIWDFVAPGDALPAEIHSMFIINIPAVKVEKGSRFTCEDARRIAAPTLSLTGDRSPSGFRLAADAVAHCVMRGELVMIPRASHPMQILNPQAFNAAVLKFVAQH